MHEPRKQGNGHRGEGRKREQNRARSGRRRRGKGREEVEGGTEGDDSTLEGNKRPLPSIPVPHTQANARETREEDGAQRRKRGGGWLTRAAMGRSGFLQGWGSASSPIPSPPPAGWALLCSASCLPVCLGGRPKARCSGEALRAVAPRFLPCPASPSPAPPRDPHLLCRRGKVLEIRGLAVSAKEKQFS